MPSPATHSPTTRPPPITPILTPPHPPPQYHLPHPTRSRRYVQHRTTIVVMGFFLHLSWRLSTRRVLVALTRDGKWLLLLPLLLLLLPPPVLPLLAAADAAPPHSPHQRTRTLVLQW